MKAIYYLKHIESGRIYVGSTLNFPNRKKRHLSDLKKGIHHCAHLQRAWNKYGETRFQWGILEQIESADSLLEREQFWIDEWKQNGALFNACSIAGNCLGIKQSKETVEKKRDKLMGHKVSEATKKLIGAKAKIRGISESTMAAAILAKTKPFTFEEAESVKLRNSNGERYLDLANEFSMTPKTLRKKVRNHFGGVFNVKRNIKYYGGKKCNK